MVKKKRKTLKRIVWTVIFLIVGGFALNWFLAHRLESYLKQELTKRVSEATNGFYRLDFSNLNIGIINGELEIDSVLFRPDSTLFSLYKQKDTLPPTYLDLTINKIHFKGINLIWRVSYKELNFKLFEIQKPVIAIYDSNYSGRFRSATQNQSTQDLYDLISPYIDVLTVKQMNLVNASVTYTTGKEDNVSEYRLHDVSFHAYGFRLDDQSYDSGKLLYSDNFDFTTNRPQTLLTNNQFLFNTENIYLSTEDSLIRIDKVNLLPQKMLWAQKNMSFDSYVEANVGAIEVKGIKFKRENAKNYLEARSFDISRSEIQYFDTRKDSTKVKEDKLQARKDTLDLSWSLYSIISPVLQSVTVDNIGIEDAKFAYSTKSDEDVDLYSLNDFNFNAFGFRVDSLADKEKRFLYSESYSIDATGINGTLRSKNHVITVEEMFLDTQKGDFDVRMVRVWPIDTRTDEDYIRGTVDSLKISEMFYEKGLKAKELVIDAPSVEYVRMSQESTSKPDHNRETVRPGPVSRGAMGIITLFVDYLNVGKIYLNRGNIIYRDRQDRDEPVYRLPKIDFFAENVLLNKQTIDQAPAYVTYDNYGFRFDNFDNVLPGKNYRLKIKRGVYTGLNGNLMLRNIELIPQQSHSKNTTGTHISFSSPAIDVTGIDYVLGTSPDKFGFASVHVDSPHLRVTKGREQEQGKSGGKNGNIKMPKITLGTFRMTNADVGYIDENTRDSAAFAINDISLNKLVLASSQDLSVGSILLHRPVIFMKSVVDRENASDSGAGVISGKLFKAFDLQEFKVYDLKMNIDNPTLKLDTDVPSVDISRVNLKDSKFSMQSMVVSKPTLKMNKIVNSDKIGGLQENDESGIYQNIRAFARELHVNTFELADARIDYINTLNGKSIRQQHVNSTDVDFKGLNVDAEKQRFSMDDFNFSTKNLNFPLDNGFYTLQIGEIDLHKENRMLMLSNLHLVPAYPKEEFAYRHPRHKDWFDVSVGKIRLSEIDYPTYFSDNILNIGDARIDDVKLLNYKNQKIEVEHNIMPMIYEGLQKAPLMLDINNLDVSNFMVVYEELPKNGDVPGKIFFTEMNGKFSGFTNIVKRKNQYIKLEADGKFMGKGDFSAIWMLPVDSLNDNFVLTAKLRDFDMTELNQLINPLAPAKVNSGMIDSLILKTEASSKGATVQMRMIYNDLDFTVFKEKDGETMPDRFITGIANAFVKTNNPNKPGKAWREPYLTLERDPYHSTFNYLWQIIQPPLVETVGISQKTQNFFKGVSNFAGKVKNFFTGGSKKAKKDKTDDK